HRTSRPRIPLIRRVILLYELPNRVFLGAVVISTMHHRPIARTKKVRDPISGPAIQPVHDAAFCHNSSGFLAAAYASCDCSGILRGAYRRDRVSSTTGQRRETSAVVARRSGQSDRPGARAERPRRGFLMLERLRPRFV